MSRTTARSKGEVRRAQLVTTYGVGSVVALGDESFMVAGIDSWDGVQVDLHEPRLEQQLRVRGFVQPPAASQDDSENVPVVRFPSWYYCPECRALQRHSHFTSFNKNKCNTCNVELVPSRFVVACAKGHIADFPYFAWVHAGVEGREAGTHSMRIKFLGSTSSLAGIVISCGCGRSRTMEGAFSRDALKGIRNCHGDRPWLKSDDEACDQTPRVLQRGASNVWFSVVSSALSIPPWSDGAFHLLRRCWPSLEHTPEGALEETIRGMGVANGSGYSVADLVAAVMQRRGSETDVEPKSTASIKAEEYEALIRGKAEKSSNDEFVCVKGPEIPSDLGDWLPQIMVVRRLREVRALTGFTRVLPLQSGDLDLPQVAPLFTDETENPYWLPAIEVMGEGVFFRLKDDRLREWEQRSDVVERARIIDERYRSSFIAKDKSADRDITPRFLAIHTLSHAVITQWSLECGYPAASLRERLYVSDEMCGFLVFTASGDSAGSMGGIIGLAQESRLQYAFQRPFGESGWCSADPLCIEATATGTDSLNLAACHACALLPETSCEERNVLLDRALVIGTPDNPELGLLGRIAQEL